MTIKFESTVLFVQDINTSRRFYEELLGQKVLMDFGPNVGFEGGFAIWQNDHANQIIFEHPPENTAPLGRRNIELYFETEDLEAIWTKLTEAHVETIHPIREHPWGQRGFHAYDPDGHIVEIGEPMPIVVQRFLSQGISIEDVAKRTFMPLEIVQHIAQSGQ